MSPKLLFLLLPAVRAFYDDEALPAQPPWSEEALYLEKEVALLATRVAVSRGAEQRAAATNAQLKGEVQGWKEVGAKVMNREAHIFDRIKQSQNEARVADQPSLRAAVIGGVTSSESDKKRPLALDTRSIAESTSTGLPPLLVQWHLAVLLITAVATLAFCLRAPTDFSWSLFNKEKLLEISELQLEGVPLEFGEGYLLVQPSGGLRSRTRVIEQREGSSLLRFSETITLSMRKGEGHCLITVFQRGEANDKRIGTALLQHGEIIRQLSEGSEYFRFKVQAAALSLNQEFHVAMRIRDLAGLPGALKSKAGIRSSMMAV